MDFVIPAWFEATALAALVLILAADLLLILRRPHVPSMREATAWVVFYVLLALLFALVLRWVTGSTEATGQFVAGWLTEYSLSVDNLFVFVLLMSQFAVPRRHQQEVLMVGIVIALVLRGVFILLGAALIESFSEVFYLFGAFLVYTAWRQAFPRRRAEGTRPQNGIVRFLGRFFDVSDHYDGARLRTRIDGRTVLTPMLLVFLALGFTDLMFAVDSIPAVFGITSSPFLVFAANLFALMGLRQLFFLLGGLVDRLRYLHYGIAFVLAFIGVKLVLHALHVDGLPFVDGGAPIRQAPDISTGVSLIVIVVAVAAAAGVSLAVPRRDGDPARPDRTGR